MTFELFGFENYSKDLIVGFWFFHISGWSENEEARPRSLFSFCGSKNDGLWIDFLFIHVKKGW